MLIRPAQREYRTWSTDSRRWSPYVARPSDIIIATSPKCGTTWMQQIVSSLVFGDAEPRALPPVSPWIDARFRGTAAEVHAAIERQSHRRFLKSHLPIDGLPLYEEVRYIHVARDGRDAALSMHNHYSGLSASQLESFDRIGLDDSILGKPYPKIPADAAEYFRLWISTPIIPGQEDGLPAPSFFELESSYWAERKRANFLLVHYNDLKHDLDGEMRRISQFLEIEIPQTTWPSLVSAANFESMRAAGSTLMPQTRSMFVEGSDRFFNMGVNGRWRGVFEHSDLMLYNTKVQAKLSPALAAWLEGGRLTTRDPREMPD
jgi:aryl sulfotransferase